MENLVVIPNVNKDNELAVTDEVISRLLSLGFNVYIHSSVGYAKEGVSVYDKLPECIELMVVIGGDGSVIDACGLAVERPGSSAEMTTRPPGVPL